MYPANSYVIRQAADADTPTLHRLAELDGRKPFAGPALIAESGGVAVAAISLFDERVVADPFAPTTVPVQLLRMRLGALRAYSASPSVADRVRAAVQPFVSSAAVARAGA
jgi:hypothetical protein